MRHQLDAFGELPSFDRLVLSSRSDGRIDVALKNPRDNAHATWVTDTLSEALEWAMKVPETHSDHRMANEKGRPNTSPKAPGSLATPGYNPPAKGWDEGKPDDVARDETLTFQSQSEDVDIDDLV